MIPQAAFQVIGIGCSPRRGGNTDILVNHVLDGVKEQGVAVEFLRISEMKILPCDACWTCAETDSCHIDDDMQGIYPRLLQASGIVIGSPVHMGYNVSGQSQVFFDRTFPLWHRKRLRNKVGASVASANRRGAINTINVINNVFFNHDMIIAGYANGYGRNPGDILKDERALREAYTLGKRLIEIIKNHK